MHEVDPLVHRLLMIFSSLTLQLLHNPSNKEMGYTCIPHYTMVYHSKLQYITVYHSYYNTVYHSILQYITVYHRIWAAENATEYYYSTFLPRFVPHVQMINRYTESYGKLGGV